MTSNTARRWRTAGTAVAFTAVLTAAAAAGCSGRQLVDDMPAAATETSTEHPRPSATPSSTTSAPKIPTSVDVPGAGDDDADLLRGPSTVYTGCGGSLVFGDDVKLSRGQVFLPTTGRNVDLPLPTIPDGKLVVATQCLVAGDARNIRVVHIVSLRTPSSGLTPESTETQILAFDPTAPDAPTATGIWPVEYPLYNFESLQPTVHGFMAYGSGGVLGFDIASMNLAWQSATKPAAVNFDGYAFWSREGDARDSRDQLYRIAYHSAKDGTEIGHTVGPDLDIETYPHGFMAMRGTKEQWERMLFDTRTAQFQGPLPSEGQLWGNRMLRYHRTLTDEDTTFIKVWDVNTGQVIFTREGADVSGLNIEDVYLAGNYLYIENDADSPVIDITTSDKVSSGWSVRPVDIVDDDWFMVVDGPVSNGYASCFDGLRYICYEDGRLVHAPDGVLAGPWF